MNAPTLRRALAFLRFLVGRSWTHVLLRIGLAAGLFGAGALLFVWLGLAPIAASHDHWLVTQRFLGFAMRNAVETRSMRIEEPPLDQLSLVLKGAGHYATGCAPCHGAPGKPRSPIVLQMVPEPPVLPPLLVHWKARELFWIVRHGLKYTAMPGWSAEHRDDEVWALVAFLRELPHMRTSTYRVLAHGDGDTAGGGSAAAARLRTLGGDSGPVLADCARCHGSDGNGRGAGTVPRLAGQREEYLLASLAAFAVGARESGIMEPVAAALDADTMAAVARYYATRVPRPQPPAEPGAIARTLLAVHDPKGALRLGPLDPTGIQAAVARGAALAARGDAAGKVPACKQCHGPGGGERNPHYPRLAGQPAEYLALQLALFHQGVRGGSAWHGLMDVATERLDAGQIRALALYYASLEPEA